MLTQLSEKEETNQKTENSLQLFEIHFHLEMLIEAYLIKN